MLSTLVQTVTDLLSIATEEVHIMIHYYCLHISTMFHW